MTDEEGSPPTGADLERASVPRDAASPSPPPTSAVRAFQRFAWVFSVLIALPAIFVRDIRGDPGFALVSMAILFVPIGWLLGLAGAIGDGLAMYRSVAARTGTRKFFFAAQSLSVFIPIVAFALMGPTDRRDAPAEFHEIVRAEPPFAVSLPWGWRREENDERLGRTVYAGAKDGAQTWLFTSNDGGYLSVQLDGRDGVLRPDAVWKAVVRGDGLTIEAEGEPCRRASDPADVTMACPEGNGQLDVRVLAATPYTELGPVQVKGHAYRIQFGNVKREVEVDLEPFRRILVSFRAM